MKKKDNEKYEKILKAAIEIILEDGAATLSTTKVARRVKISQSNIYIYFKNKDDLLQQIYQLEIDCYKTLFDDILHNDHDTLTKISEYIHALYDVSIKNPDSMYVIEQIKQIPDSPISLTNPDYIDLESNPILNLMNQGITEGILKEVNPNLYLTMIFNTIRMNSLNVKNQQPASSFRTILDLLLRGMQK